MSTSAFYITLATEQSVPVSDYTATTGQIVQAFYTALGTHAKFVELTHTSEHTDLRVELEVIQEFAAAESPILAHAVVQGTNHVGKKKLQFDKAQFSELLRELLPFPVKVSKRAVPKEEMLGSEDNPVLI